MRTKLIRIAVTLFFWVLSYLVLINIFASGSAWQEIDHIYTAIFIVTLMIPVTINSFFVRPRFLKNGSYYTYASLVVSIILLGALLNQVLFDQFIDYILSGYYFISYYEYADLLKFFFAFVVLTTLIDISFDWFQLEKDRHRIVLLEKEKLNAELRALTSQVNPHFLFNSLTVLYTLSLKNMKETSEAIIKLSDIMRYVIYQSNETAVSISSEAAILRDYIDLQRYRVHPTTRITFVDAISSDRCKVAPMLFLPLIENSFKHGVHGEVANAFVDVSLREDAGVINFSIVNNKPAGTLTTLGGIGLSNVRSRLELLYPGKHKMTITDTGKTFTVQAEIVSIA
jgi:sensor histidine kinase YesM